LAIATSSIGIAAQGDTHLKPLQNENFDETAEYRLTSLRGQDRSVKHLNYARETDKACLPLFTFEIENAKYTVRPLAII